MEFLVNVFKKLRLLIFIFGLLAALGFILSRVLAGSQAPAESSLEALTDPRAATVVGGAGTDEYNRLVDGQNSRAAAEARLSGESYVPVPTGGGAAPARSSPSPLVRGVSPAVPPGEPGPSAPSGRAARQESFRMRERPAAARAPERLRSSEVAASGNAGALPREDRTLAADLKAIRDAMARRGVPEITLVEAPERPAAPIQPAPPAPEAPAGLAAGKILYAVTDLAIDSDVPGPVLATVAEGPLKGAKALGDFRAAGESVVISFTRIVPDGGPEIRVEAVGVDPDLSRPSVRAAADTHFWERWGSLAAASFIEGLGDAASGRRTRVYVSGDRVVEEGLGKTLGDMTLEAVGKVGGRAAAQVERGFDRPPTVRVRAGEHVGILILSLG